MDADSALIYGLERRVASGTAVDSKYNLFAIPLLTELLILT